MARLLFVGPFGDKLGETQLPLMVPEGIHELAGLITNLTELDPRYALVLAGQGYRLAINQEFAKGKDAIADSDEIAFLPPVSGG